jgi:hypothetical protein
VKKRTYYGFEAAYGPDAFSNGYRIGSWHGWHSRAARDAWVAEGSPYVDQAGAREAVPSSDPELRRLLARGWPWGDMHECGICDLSYE